MGSGNSHQKSAMAQQEGLTARLGQIAGDRNAREQDIYNKVSPQLYDRMNNGLSFFPALMDYTSGTNAQAFAPARATMNRNLESFGSLPSGFKAQTMADFENNRARAFDQGIAGNLAANEGTKVNAMNALMGQQQLANPLGYYQAAQQGNQSVMQMPQQQSPWGSILGGAVSGAMSLF